MNQPNGIHHLALSTGDMKGQVEFFTEVLGMHPSTGPEPIRPLIDIASSDRT
jgi:catechol 2,3-dioxygenase-like lactoylglutathione lyase family enzyme